MKGASLSSILKAVVPIAIGLGLVLYSYLSTPEEVRSQIYRYVAQADLRFVGLSLFIALLSHCRELSDGTTYCGQWGTPWPLFLVPYLF